jgi:hypothetical protein
MWIKMKGRPKYLILLENLGVWVEWGLKAIPRIAVKQSETHFKTLKRYIHVLDCCKVIVVSKP